MSAPNPPAPAGLRARIERHFLPPVVAARGREAVIRSRAILVVVGLGLIGGMLSAALDFATGARAIASPPPLPRPRGGGALRALPHRLPDLAGSLLVAILFAWLLALGLLTLGRGPAVTFLFLVPVLAVLFCARGAALAWSLLAAAAILLLWALAASSLPAPVELKHASPTRVHRIGLLAVLVSTACLLTCDVMRSRALQELERPCARAASSIASSSTCRPTPCS